MQYRQLDSKNIKLCEFVKQGEWYKCTVCGFKYDAAQKCGPNRIRVCSGHYDKQFLQAAANRPGLLAKAVHYLLAILKYLIHGCPKRAKRQIEKLLAICRKCDHYDPEKETCTKCGCCANATQTAWRNKLAMKTEKCPDGRW